MMGFLITWLIAAAQTVDKQAGSFTSLETTDDRQVLTHGLYCQNIAAAKLHNIYKCTCLLNCTKKVLPFTCYIDY